MKLKEFRQKMQENPEFAEAAGELKLHFELANAILRARLKKGWSQAELADSVGTKQANISRIETGLANPTLTLIQKLMSVLDLEIKITASDYKVSAKNVIFMPALNAYAVPDWPNSICNTRYEIKSDASIEEGKLL